MTDRDDELSQAYLAAIVASSDDAIISKDLNGTIKSFNAAAERLFGYRADEIVGKPVLVLLPQDRKHEETEILAKLRRGERIDHFETVRITKDGRLLDISLTVSPVRDSHGTIIGASKIARDITERKRSARESAAQQAWFRVTLESIGDAVIASDPGGLVTFLNPAAENLTGWPSDEAAGRPLHEVFDIIDEKTRRRVENPAEVVIREGRRVGLANSTVLRSRDGREWMIDDSAAPILDDERRIIGVVLVFRDVTEQRTAEVALTKQRHAVSAEREGLLERERRARAEAERANRVKDDFVAMVSHELRTPLSAILGWTSVLQAKPGDEAVVRQGLEIIARNARNQAQLVSDLLDVSRIASEKLALELESVDLEAVIAESIESVEHAAREQGVTIHRRTEGKVPSMLGDPARLKQVIWNLLANAVKFTPEGGRIGVTLCGYGTRAEIEVADSGIGIRPEEMSDLFERFRQPGTSTATTRRFGGLGLGLSIARHLVELHGGVLRAASEGEGKGATFTVELPLTTPTRPRAQDAAGEPRAGAGGPPLGGITVLLVEDEPDMRAMIRKILEDHGARVLTASSAPEAFDQLDRGADILLSDIRLPDIDGYDLIRQVRGRADRSARIPAVALTAFARGEDRARAMRAGFQGHIAKPFDNAELVDTLAGFAGMIRASRVE